MAFLIYGGTGWYSFTGSGDTNFIGGTTINSGTMRKRRYTFRTDTILVRSIRDTRFRMHISSRAWKTIFKPYQRCWHNDGMAFGFSYDTKDLNDTNMHIYRLSINTIPCCSGDMHRMRMPCTIHLPYTCIYVPYDTVYRIRLLSFCSLLSPPMPINTINNPKFCCRCRVKTHRYVRH